MSWLDKMKQQADATEIHRQYWRWNLTIMIVLLLGWALVGLGGGILFADTLNEINIPGTGFPLGFWMAHQGSIIGFVIIILVYCISLNFLDKWHQRQISELAQSESK